MIAAHPGLPAFVKIFHMATMPMTAIASEINETVTRAPVFTSVVVDTDCAAPILGPSWG